MRQLAKLLWVRSGLVLRSIRAPFLLAIISPVFLGAAIAQSHGFSLSLSKLTLSLIGSLFLHAGANAANDYYDWLSGCDPLRPRRPFSGGSQVIQEGLLTAGEVRRIYMLCYLAALAIGCYLAIQAGPAILIIGLLGLALGHFYSAGPLRLAYRSYGEVTVGIAFGPLPVLGSYLLHAGGFDWAPLVVALPVGLLICAVLYINQFPDQLEDAGACKRTWVVRTDGETIRPYLLMVSLAMIILLAILWFIRGWIGVAFLPVALLAARSAWLGSRLFMQPERLIPVQVSTLILHSATGFLLTLAFFFA